MSRISIKNKHSRTCPRCRIPLKVCNHKWVEVDVCTSCKGSWFDQWELKACLGFSRRDLLDYLPISKRQWSDSGLPCPSCGKPLKTLKANPIFPFDIEVCQAEKGYWLDWEEIKPVKEIIAEKKLRIKKRDNAEKDRIEEEVVQRKIDLIERRYRGKHRPEDNAEILTTASFYDLTPVQQLIAFTGMPVESGNLYESKSWMNFIVILANVLVFGLMLLLSGSYLHALFGNFPKDWYMTYGLIPNQLVASPISKSYTLITSMFIHGGLLHLLGNMFFLFTTGDNIEKRMGHFKFLAFFLVSGVVADIVSIIAGSGSAVPHVGASGAIAGVMGAYMILCRHKSFYLWIFKFVIFGKMISVSAWVYLLFWLVFQIISAQTGEHGVDYWAHIGGFGFGLIVGIIVKYSQSFNAMTGEWEWKWKQKDKEEYLQDIRYTYRD